MVMWLCFYGGVVVWSFFVFLWWCGGVVVFLWWCGRFLCFCGGVILFLWWCGDVVLFLIWW